MISPLRRRFSRDLGGRSSHQTSQEASSTAPELASRPSVYGSGVGGERAQRELDRRSSRLQVRVAHAVATRRVFPWLAGVTAFIAISTGIIVRAIDKRDFHSIGDGIWWSIVTLATVGYGDIVPTTSWGRVIGGLVIVFGVTFLAFLTATVTSLFVSSEQAEAAEKERTVMSRGEEEIIAALRKLDERVGAIESKLDRRA
jgi:hypothetical protein